MKFKIFCILLFIGLFCLVDQQSAQAQTSLRRPASYRRYDAQDWGRFFHYPYVYYNQNFQSMDQYRSADSLYYRYDRPMQVPMYNPYWQNYYPVPRRFHEGTHFVLDVM